MRSSRTRAGRYLLRRLGVYLLTAYAAITLNFLVPRLMPGDPAQTLASRLEARTGTAVTPEQMASYHAFFGDPTSNLGQQYVHYWGRLVHLDLGLSIGYYPVPAVRLIADALPWTLFLAGSAVVTSFLLGCLLGVWTGSRPGSRLDAAALPLASFFGALPPFWVAMLLIYFVAFKTGVLPFTGAYSPDSEPGFHLRFGLSVLHYGLLPIAATVLSGFGFWLLQMRNMMITTVTEDYVLLARAKGLSNRRIQLRYAARNAMLPPITNFATAITGVVGGLLFTELVFNYPGVGTVLVQAVTTKDFPVMQGVFLMLTLAVLVGNLIADSIYVLLDPRTREAER